MIFDSGEWSVNDTNTWRRRHTYTQGINQNVVTTSQTTFVAET